MQFSKYSLNAGELSDELAGRIDLSKVHMGMRRAENVRVLRAGGVTRRAGFEFVGIASGSASASRLQGVRFADQQGFVLEFGEYTMRVFRDGQFIMDGASPLELVTPWSLNQVFALQFAQRTNQIVVVHPEVEPQFITFNPVTSGWSLQVFPWQERVWELPFVENVQVKVLKLGDGIGETIIDSTEPIFDSSWVGTRLKVSHIRAENITRGTLASFLNGKPQVNLSTTSYSEGDIVYEPIANFNTNFDSSQYVDLAPLGDRVYYTCVADYDHTTDYISGRDTPNNYQAYFTRGAVLTDPKDTRSNWSFETMGTWKGTYVVERSYDNGASWQALKILTSNLDKNFLLQDEEAADSKALLRALSFDISLVSGSIPGSIVFTISPFRVSGVGKLTKYKSTTQMDIDMETPVERGRAVTGFTSDWEEEAFSPKNGYPKTCTFHQKRLFFGGSKARPQSIWASKIRQPFNFFVGALADDGLNFETEAVNYESVLWLASHLSLVVGTTTGIWAITSPDGLSLTPESNAIARQVHNGVKEGVEVIPLENNILYLQTKGRKIRELTGGSYEYGGYTDVDLTQLASHITRGGVTQLAAMQVPDATLLLVSGGELAVLTYERGQNVVGWTRWVTDGVIESVATCPGAGEDDEIYIVVLRDGVRSVERLAPDMPRVEEAGDIEDLNFLDSSVTKESGTAFTTVGSLDHLEGREVQVFADGESLGTMTVADNAITLSNAVNRATVGLPFTSFIETMSLDQGQIGNKSGISSVVVRLRNSLGAECSQNGEQWARLLVGQPDATADVPNILQNGDAVVVNQASWGRQPTFSVRQTTPFPLTILAIRLDGRTSR